MMTITTIITTIIIIIIITIIIITTTALHTSTFLEKPSVYGAKSSHRGDYTIFPETCIFFVPVITFSPFLLCQ